MNCSGALWGLLAVCSPVLAGGEVIDSGPVIPNAEELENSNAIIGQVVFEKLDVFDTSNAKENKSVFRLANRLHIDTRRSTVKSQLLFRPGELFSQQKISESERLLRLNAFLYDARIRPTHYQDGVVDLTVTTRDNWTLFPELSFSRSGGENDTVFGLEEQNLLGTGSRISITREDDVNRTSTVFEFSDRNIGRSWVRLDLAYADSDDGDSRALSVFQPFYSLDAHRSGGVTLNANDRIDPLYSNGDQVVKYRHDQRFATVSYGWSRGLVNGWARRWSIGAVTDRSDFSPVVEQGFLQRTPADRDLRYPYFGIQVLEDRYVKSTNLNQIIRTEDVYLGTHYSLRLGWAAESFGSDRNALVLAGSYGRGFGSPDARLLLVGANAGGRVESGQIRNARLRATTRYFRRQSDRRLFYAALTMDLGDNLDLDNSIFLGGDTGLRGYPQYYRNGNASALLTLEQRYYTNYYPFRLVRVGAALFLDAGRTWGMDVSSRKDNEILIDVGIGLRLANTRGGGNKIWHIDLAFPLNGDSSIDSVQLLFSGKRSF